jgi:hypothetical protein
MILRIRVLELPEVISIQSVEPAISTGGTRQSKHRDPSFQIYVTNVSNPSAADYPSFAIEAPRFALLVLPKKTRRFMAFPCFSTAVDAREGRQWAKQPPRC